MLKFRLLQCFRSTLLLVVLIIAGFFLVFLSSPDVSIYKSYVEQNLKKELQTEQFEISHLKVTWNEGPAIDAGQVFLTSPSLAISDTNVELSYSLLDIFLGNFAPKLKLSGGMIFLNLDN